MNKVTNVVFPWTYALSEKNTDQDGGAAGENIFGLLVGIIFVVVGIYAGYLCWMCNKKEDLGLRVIYTLLAFFNAIPYLIYYLAIRVIIGAPCLCCGGQVSLASRLVQ